MEPFATLVIFGGTGDLAQRMLFPSLYNLWRDRLLPADIALIGAARADEDDASFGAQVAAALRAHLPADRIDDAAVADFIGRLGYVRIDASAREGFAELAERLAPRAAQGVAFYLSTPPGLFAPTVAGLAEAGLTGERTRVAMEKPIGQDLPSSQAVNAAVRAAFPEPQVFRVDHYLGKETVQNLLVLRFANVMFEPLWNARFVEHVQITVAETVGLEGRVSYYEGVGALADMVQNHMLQLLALVAMEPPASYAPAAVRDEKVKVLRSLRPFTSESASTASVRGQYRAGAIGGAPVPGYADELGRASGTETFVAVKAHIDNWRWHGVPFYLRTGKRLPARRSEIAIQFRGVPHQIFGARTGGSAIAPNRLLIRIQPDEGIALALTAKEPGLDRGGMAFREVDLDVSLAAEVEGQRRRIAYERLLLDLLKGDPTLFVRADEVEAAWSWVDGIHAAWKAAGTPVRSYTAGSWGPSAAEGMIERDGASWHEDGQ